MIENVFSSLSPQYHGFLSIITGLGIVALTMGFGMIARMIPSVKLARQVNQDTYKSKMEKPNYAANQMWNRKWSLGYLVVIFGLILPFCLTAEPQHWSRVLRDMFIILMVYDFVYYLTHRFLFHDNGIFGGPLKWMHAIHHRQHNPCKGDSSYIHPLEVAVGLGLYVATIFFLSSFLGNFHVVTIVVTWFAFSGINTHNHALWEDSKMLFGIPAYASRMHHHHHARFTGGNYATITLLYDWMFGTLDHGEGWQKKKS
jgi:sterol desaturase/sphingolipid hydroxylase (fatty acid hydroxylase superfamily)